MGFGKREKFKTQKVPLHLGAANYQKGGCFEQNACRGGFWRVWADELATL